MTTDTDTVTTAMAMTATGTDPTVMPGSTLLQLIWLASPALPVGGFSYSEGLEAAVDGGRVRDEAEARAWLLDQLDLGLACADLPLVAAVHAAWQCHDAPRLSALNDWVRCTRESAELRQQTEQMGRSLLEWLRLRGVEGKRLLTLASLAPAPTWPVAYGLAAWHTGAAAREGLLAFAFAWAENMVQAALKAVPLGQSAGQRILGALCEAIPVAVEAALARDETTWQAHTPMLAILSSQHETQYSRLFRS